MQFAWKLEVWKIWYLKVFSRRRLTHTYMDLLSLPFSATSTKCEIALCVCTHTLQQHYTLHNNACTCESTHVCELAFPLYTHLFMEVNSTLIFFNKGKRKGSVGALWSYSFLLHSGVLIRDRHYHNNKHNTQNFGAARKPIFFLVNFSASVESLNTKYH